MSAVKAYPCPFCGSTDLSTPGLCYVACNDCGARGPDFQVGLAPETLWNSAEAAESRNDLIEALNALNEIRIAMGLPKETDAAALAKAAKAVPHE